MTNHHTDPAAVSPLRDRSAHLYAIYGGPGAQHAADVRDEQAAARVCRERMRADELAAFTAPALTDHHGRLI